MVDDPYTYDINEFANEFTWAIAFWNLAENNARWMLSGILGGHTAIHALAVDLGSRSLGEALRSASRGMDDKNLRQHVQHFVKGYSRLGEYRNLYVHGLMSLQPVGDPDHRNAKKLQGYIMIEKAKGRLKAINQPITVNEMQMFKKHCMTLLDYGKAIKIAIGLDDVGIREMLGMPQPLLEKPVWPDPPNQRIHYIQD